MPVGEIECMKFITSSTLDMMKYPGVCKKWVQIVDGLNGKLTPFMCGNSLTNLTYNRAPAGILHRGLVLEKIATMD